jgi:hypothetical protein
MTQNMTNDYDTYAYLMLLFVCNDCKAHIEPKQTAEACGDEYCFDLARKAEAGGWYIGFGQNMPCLCPDCRKKRGL